MPKIDLNLLNYGKRPNNGNMETKQSIPYTTPSVNKLAERSRKYAKNTMMPTYSIINNIDNYWNYIKPDQATNHDFKGKFESNGKDLLSNVQERGSDSTCRQREQLTNYRTISAQPNNPLIEDYTKQRMDTEWSQELELDLVDDTFRKTFDGR